MDQTTATRRIGHDLEKHHLGNQIAFATDELHIENMGAYGGVVLLPSFGGPYGIFLTPDEALAVCGKQGAAAV
jgi:hypothetical protein